MMQRRIYKDMYHLIFDKSIITCSLICIDRKMEKSSVVEIGRIKNSLNFLLLIARVWTHNIKEKFNSLV